MLVRYFDQVKGFYRLGELISQRKKIAVIKTLDGKLVKVPVGEVEKLDENKYCNHKCTGARVGTCTCAQQKKGK